MSTPLLLQTKFLIPRLVPSHLPRPHLVDLIRSNCEQRIILLTAPAGYGKTTLMVETVAALGRPVVWYQLDAGDNDPTTFIAYLVEGLCRIRPSSAEKSRRLLNSPNPPPPSQMLVFLLNELLEDMAFQWTLVLDDYHFVSNPVVHELAAVFLERHPSNMSAILSTRTTPPLPLSRWRARGQLAELRLEHLRFSHEESETWLNQVLPQLPHALTERLSVKSEGWGAGLQLAATLVAEKPLPEAEGLINNLSGAHPYIFHYLMDEVLDHQPPALQEFLLHSAILTQMDASLCELALGITSAQTHLETLQRENLFLIALDDQQRWYRYHHLFQEFLQDKLVRQSPQTLYRLCHQTGEYFLAVADYEMAAHYFLRAGEQSKAAQAILRFAPKYLESGRADILSHYLSQLGPAELQHQPELALYLGQSLRQRGLLGEAVVYLKQAFQGASDLDAVDIATLAMTELASLARSRGDYTEAQQRAARAVECSRSAGPAVRAFALMEQAKCEGFLNGMEQGYAIALHAIEAMRHAEDSVEPSQQAQLLRSLGQICWWYGNVSEAILHAEEALRRLSELESPLAADLMLLLATLYLYRHEYDGALKFGQRALDICQRLHAQELLSNALTVLGNVLTRVGRLGQAESCLRQAIDLASQLQAASYTQVMAGSYLAYNLVAQGRIDEAQQIAETALWPHENRAMVYEIYVCRSVLADIYLEKHEVIRAKQIFESLIEIGEARQYRIPLAMANFGLAYILLSEDNQERGLELAQKSLYLLESSRLWELYVDQKQRAVVVCQALEQIIPDNPFLRQVLQVLRSKVPDVTIIPTGQRPIRVQTFGSFRVFHNEAEIQPKMWGSAKARDLLAYFVTFRHEHIPLDKALDALWPSNERQSKTAFHTALYRLRQALNVGESTTRLIMVEMGDYRLDLSRFEIDVELFDQYIKKAQESDSKEAKKSYWAALDLYKGEYLNNLYYNWLLIERQRLSESHLQAMYRLGKLYTQVGDLEQAVTLHRRVVQFSPLWEEAHCEIMRILYQLGDRQGVIKQYRIMCDLLQQEIGASPLPSTRDLFQSLTQSFRP